LQQLRQLQDELVQAEKLASLGLLVAGVAHELNTPLGSAKVTASTMARRLDDALHALGERPADPAQVGGVLRHLRAGLDIIDHSLERSGEVIRLFKQLAVDRGTVERRQFALDDVLHDVRRLLGPRLAELARGGRTVTLVIDPTGGILLDSYPGPLGQVIENLLGNALLHAFDPPLDDGRTPVVTVRSHTEPDPGGHGPADDWLVLDVIDNGHGIDAQVLPRIFDPFFTTRRGRGGTGIGLHLCHHFCTQVLGGRILADCRPGQGCRFTVRIPLRAP
jgi:signal transduction histidine kinase